MGRDGVLVIYQVHVIVRVPFGVGGTRLPIRKDLVITAVPCDSEIFDDRVELLPDILHEFEVHVDPPFSEGPPESLFWLRPPDQKTSFIAHQPVVPLLRAEHGFQPPIAKLLVSVLSVRVKLVLRAFELPALIERAVDVAEEANSLCYLEQNLIRIDKVVPWGLERGLDSRLGAVPEPRFVY